MTSPLQGFTNKSPYLVKHVMRKGSKRHYCLLAHKILRPQPVLSRNHAKGTVHQFQSIPKNDESTNGYLKYLLPVAMGASFVTTAGHVLNRNTQELEKEKCKSFLHKLFKMAFAECVKEMGQKYQENSIPQEGVQFVSQLQENHKINILVHSRNTIQKSAENEKTSNKVRQSILHLTGRPKHTQFIAIVGDTPGAFGLGETDQVRDVMSEILEKWVFDSEGKVKKDRLFMYGLTGSSKKDGRAGINPVVTSIINKTPLLATSMVGLCVDYGTSKVIAKFGADIPENISHVIVTTADPHIDPVSKEAFPGANFGSDSPINNFSELTLLFAGGNQTAKEVVDALAHGSVILGVKGLRGQNNPDTYMNGKSRAFLEAAELLDVVTKYMVKNRDSDVTRAHVDKVIQEYIYGKNNPKSKNFTDVENQKRLIFKPDQYDSDTKLGLFLQMRELLLDPKVYKSLPDLCVILDAKDIAQLPEIFESLSKRKVSPSYFNLPKYEMDSIDCSKGFDPSQEEFKKMIRDGFYQIVIPEKLKHHVECLRKFNDLCFTTLKHKYDWRFNQEHPSEIGPVDGYIEDNVHPMKEADPSRKRNNQVNRMTLGKLPEKNLWEYYPEDVQVAASEVEKFGQDMIQSILKRLGIKEEDYSKATGGSALGMGSTYLCNNQMDASVKGVRAIALHKDWSYLSALIRSSNPGLAAEINGEWMRVQVSSEDEMIFNFGTTFALLTEHLQSKEKIVASNHFVVQKGESSRSSVMFFDHHPSSKMYQIVSDESGRRLVENRKFESFMDYAVKMSKKTYDTRQASDKISTAPIPVCKADVFAKPKSSL